MIDRSTADKKHIKVGDKIGVEARARQPFTVSGLVKFGGRLDLGGATLAGFDLPTAQMLFRKEGKLDQIRVATKPGVRRGELAAGDPADPAAADAGADAARPRRRRTRGTRSVPQLPAEVPARVRRHRAVRRRVRDRQLALDHDRPAHARVRDPADARRLAKQVLALGPRSRRSSWASLASIVGLFLGLALAKRPVQAVRRGRLHAAEHRPRLQDADGRRLPASSGSS